jgi:hypothetical protein
MADLYQVSDGDLVQAADVNQYKDALEGGSEQQYALRQKAGANFVLRLPDSAGATQVSIQDSTQTTKASINSDGEITGIMLPTEFTFPTATSPSQTTSGQAVWDSDNNFLTVGTGSARVRIGALDLVGASNTEQTTTSTSAADLVTITLLRSVAANEPLLIIGQYRKTTGNASEVSLGLKINSTTVVEASAATTALARSSGNNQAENGSFEVWIGPRIANYTSALHGIYHTKVSASGAAAQAITLGPTGLTAVLPTDAVTSVTIRGISGNAGVTLGVDAVYVYAFQRAGV